jgi:hypothetical protein
MQIGDKVKVSSKKGRESEGTILDIDNWNEKVMVNFHGKVSSWCLFSSVTVIED